MMITVWEETDNKETNGVEAEKLCLLLSIKINDNIVYHNFKHVTAFFLKKNISF